MTPERWRRINEVFQGTLDQQSEERGAYLDRSLRRRRRPAR